jgi:alpha-tubulin suppressor-like RCC1 family protein
MTTAGTARCWGRNNFGQAAPPVDLGTITTITAGSSHTCAITTAGTARCWGHNNLGQATPPPDLGTITTITAGSSHTCAVTTAGDVACWGAAARGVLGSSSAPPSQGSHGSA